ncbi:carbon-nitrogen hydrolase [Planctomicrobium sp. SH664]|uniref:carbon-nitrogen hydrolase n=1 Tax=Planctomicrobium sp. SH664 TaxID=3448125 RepID=UPI003F5AE092
MARVVNVALVQRPAGLDVDANLRETAADVERAAQQGAQIICTQELFRAQYFCQSEDHSNFALAETIPGPSTETFSALAKKYGVVIVASLFEKRAQGLYHNTAVVFDADGSQLGLYRKMHIPDDPLFYEKFYFTPGDLGFKAFETRFGKIGVLICWDQWYPEGARLTALAGAEILFFPTAIGWHPKEKAEYGVAQHTSWETIQRSHAIANGVFVAAPNRIGHEGAASDGIEFWGQSFICDPSGTILKKASVDKPEILIVPCDLDRIDVQRTHWPFLRDRRIDAYGDIVKRYRD